MRLYKTSAHREDDAAATRWSTSKDGAAHDRAELTKAGYKRGDMGTEEIDFTPTKVGTVEMLNKYAY